MFSSSWFDDIIGDRREVAVRLVDCALARVALDARDGHQAPDTARVAATDDTLTFDALDGEVVRAAVARVIAVGTDRHVGHRDLARGLRALMPMMTPGCYRTRLSNQPHPEKAARLIVV